VVASASYQAVDFAPGHLASPSIRCRVTSRSLHHRIRRGLEAIASADGRDDQVKRCVARMSALLGEFFRGFVPVSNLDQFLLVLRVMLAEMRAQPALSFVNLHHGAFAPFDWTLRGFYVTTVTFRSR
jgi:hypothetical protein